jgi:hypothetical protein
MAATPASSFYATTAVAMPGGNEVTPPRAEPTKHVKQ